MKSSKQYFMMIDDMMKERAFIQIVFHENRFIQQRLKLEKLNKVIIDFELQKQKIPKLQ